MRIAGVRAVVAAFWLVTAAYCLLSAIPFAWEQFLKPGLVPAVVAFAEWHPWISTAALAATCAGLAPCLRSRHRGACTFVAAWTVIGVVLFIAPLSRLEPSRVAFGLALAALVPPVWLSLMNLTGVRPASPSLIHRHADADATSDFAACALAAVVVTAMHAAAALPAVLSYGARPAGMELLRSALMHLVVFSIVFAMLSVVRGAARLTPAPDVAEAMLARVALAGALAIFILGIVLRPLSLAGAPGALAAAAIGIAFTVTLGPRATTAPPGLAQALSGLVPVWATRSWATAIAWLAVVALAIQAVERLAATTDWNFAIAKSAAFASWLLVVAAMLRVVHARRRGPPLLPFVACVIVLGLHVAAAGPTVDGSAAGVWKGRDPSVRLIADALEAPAAVSGGLEDLLQRNTNIPRSTRVEPVTIELARLEGPPAKTRPHIFLFVIDSLRRDYLSPYNDAVSFTPAIGRFARESVVFERAFTRYGATGLAVPSIWVGGLLLHKQYVTPFAPMNTLDRLLQHEQYRQWVSMDNILDVILPSTPHRVPLDAGLQPDLRFCRTLTEVRGRLDQLSAGTEPAFVYSLPQDVHVSTITREGATSVDGASYGRFYAPYASRVRRLDACFGEFIGDLKTRRLFERSIIVLTADHGDSLGEQGRMGHAYTIFPEILQVPLIIHLPSDLSASFRADSVAPAFTTDLTPTLYALLGHHPRQPAPFFGRPLFHQATAPPPPRTDPQVMASSYGSVYAALLDGARRLYIIDGIGLREHAYVIDGSGAGRATTVSDTDRVRGQRAIRDTVNDIARFYGYRP